MNKDIVKKILTSSQINQQEFFEFITDYVKSEKDEDITQIQLMGIAQAIQMGAFNLRYAAEQSASKLGIQVINILNPQGVLIKTICEEVCWYIK